MLIAGTDFNQTVIEIKKAADPTGNNFPLPFRVALVDSNAVEAEESFLLLLNVTGEDAVVGPRSCSVVQIKRSLPPTSATTPNCENYSETSE